MNSIRDHLIYQDHHLVVCNKPSGIPVQEDLTKDPSLLRLVQAYCKQNLYLCHRIDRPVSGLVLFAKNKEAVSNIHQQLVNNQIKKEYLAIVEKKDIENSGTLSHQLIKSSKLKKSFVDTTSTVSDSILNYTLLHELDHYLLLNVELITGKFHQIRTQLAHVGMSIKGDVKYGARRGNKDRSIGLHAWKITCLHPSTKMQLNLEAKIPENDIWPVIEKLLFTV